MKGIAEVRDREVSIRRFHRLKRLRRSPIAPCGPLWCLQLLDPAGIAYVGLSNATPRIPPKPTDQRAKTTHSRDTEDEGGHDEQPPCEPLNPAQPPLIPREQFPRFRPFLLSYLRLASPAQLVQLVPIPSGISLCSGVRRPPERLTQPPTPALTPVLLRRPLSRHLVRRTPASAR